MILCKINYQVFNNFHLKYTINMDARHDKGKTLLHIACKYGHLETVKLLLSYDIDIDKQTIKCEKYHQSALHIAIENYQLDIIKLLLYHKCNVNLTDYYHKSPLHYVCPGPQGNMMIFELLIKAGANINQKYREKTLLYQAVLDNHIETVNYLLSFNASPYIPCLVEDENVIFKYVYQTPIELVSFKSVNKYKLYIS